MITINPLISFIVLSLIVTLFMSSLKRKAYRKKMVFKMYAVRDDFILSVAKGQLTEDSKVFQYYYKRINLLLQEAPNIGVDDMIKKMMVLKKGGKSTAPNFEKAQKEAESILKQKELEIDEVRTAVKNYYLVSNDMIFAHSSLTNMVFLTFIRSGFLKRRTLKFLNALPLFIRDLIPINTKNIFLATEMFAEEASSLKHHKHA